MIDGSVLVGGDARQQKERFKGIDPATDLPPAQSYSQASPEDIAGLHHRSHEECFIANSVRTEVVIEGLPVHA